MFSEGWILDTDTNDLEQVIPNTEALKFAASCNNSYMVKKDKIIAQVADSNNKSFLIEFQKGSNKVTVKDNFWRKNIKK